MRLRDVAAFLAARERVALFRLRVAAAFFAAATRFGDFLVVLRAVVLRDVAAFLAARERVALFRLRVAAAFFAAATRFGDFLVDLRAVVLRAVVLRAVVFLPVRFLVAAAFFPAATRFGDFLVDFRAVDFFAADFRAVVFRAVVFFRAVVLRAVVLRAPAFFATERFRAATDFSPDATCRRVSSCFCITAGSDIGPPIGVSAVEPSPCGRHGSGLGKSIPCSGPCSRSCGVSVEAGSSSWFSQGQPRSWVIPPPPRSGSTRSYPYTSGTKHRSSPATLTWR